MPRRNRRPAVHSPRPIRVMSADRQAALRAFAGAHLDEHALTVWNVRRSGSDELVMTGSECPTTGVRFLSCGDVLDPTAVRLAKSSGGAGNLAV
jgi:hypothetical protein